ncbi:MAG: hypothetical protein AAF998_18380 [Bacteroidota bacterium]
MSNNEKVHPQDRTGLEQDSSNHDIWTSGFDNADGAASPPPPFQLKADPLDREDSDPKRGGGLTPEQLATIKSFGLSALVGQLSETEQNDLAAFLADFQTRSVSVQFGDGKTKRQLNSNGHSLKVSKETLSNGQIQRSVEYAHGGNLIKSTTVEGTGSDIALADQEPLSVELPEPISETVEIPGKGTIKVMEDVLSMPTHSTQIGRENDVPVFDPHLYFSRHIIVNTTDGRTIGIIVNGRTNLSNTVSGPPSLEIEGESMITFEMMVSDREGQTKHVAYQATGNSLNEPIAACAESGGFASILLRPGQPGEAYLDAAIAKANTLMPSLPIEDAGKEVEIIGQSGGISAIETVPDDDAEMGKDLQSPIVHREPMAEKGTVKPWGEWTREEKRKEAWATFKNEFSWNRVGTGILLGLGVMGAAFGLLSIPAIAPFVLPVLGLLGITMGLGTIIAPLLSGRNPTEMEWLKGGLMVIGGAAVLVATVLALPKLAAAAMFIAIASGILLLAAGIVDSVVKFSEAKTARTRDELQDKARHSAQAAEQSIIDGILAILPVRFFKSRWRQWFGKRNKPRAPGEEGIQSASDEDGQNAGRRNETTATPDEATESAPRVNAGLLDEIYHQQKEIVDAVKRGEIPLTTNKEKGNFGEMLTDVEMVEAGWTPLHRRVTSLDQTIERGIDHVFTNPGPPPMHVVADSKYGSAKLKKLVNGAKQMSEQWIEDRLRNAVGRRRADEILEDGYASIVAKIKSDGSITYKQLDANARTIGNFHP